MPPGDAVAAGRRRENADDSGQVTVLIIGFAVIVVLLLVVVVNASRVFLAQRDLAAAADAASAAAAQSVSESAVYEGTAGGAVLPIDAAGARAAVATYVQLADLEDRFDDLSIVAVTTDGTTVTVTFAARVRMPFGAVLPGGTDGSYEISATATARSPFR